MAMSFAELQKLEARNPKPSQKPESQMTETLQGQVWNI
jgi:hypothetical protein